MNSFFSLRSVVIGVCLSAAICLVVQDALGAPKITEEVRKKAARDNLVKNLFRKLGAIKPYQAKKKEANDYWIIGTAQLNTETKHVDVCFQAKEGQQVSAEFLADFLLRPKDQMLWKWQVFGRVKDSYQADEALAQIRQQYDQVTAYREQMMNQYQAKTIRRC